MSFEKVQLHVTTVGPQDHSLPDIIPIKQLQGLKLSEVEFYVDQHRIQPTREGIHYANRLVFKSAEVGIVDVIQGPGFRVSIDGMWTQLFSQRQGWSGGDGIYSFNITDGNDQMDQPVKRNLLVFGDTFYGRTDVVTRRRYEPLVMTNNSMGIFDQNQIEFRVHLEENGQVTSFFQNDPEFDWVGTIASNLVTYDTKTAPKPWISGAHPKDIWLHFDFHTEQHVDEVVLYNYFSSESADLASRGIRQFTLWGSSDNKQWKSFGDYELPKSRSMDDKMSVPLNKKFRYFKITIPAIVGKGNYSDSFQEGLYALNRIEFLHQGIKYRDIRATSNTFLNRSNANSHMWLQDGVFTNNSLYLFPYQVISDHTQPEGLQFAIMGVTMIKIPVKNGQIMYQQMVQKRSPLNYRVGNSEITFGGGVTPNTVLSGAKKADGYIYIYGYKTTWVMRELVVARAFEKDIEFFDNWEFYDGHKWQSDMTKVAPLMQHISTEFSVSYINQGPYEGKTLLVFTYDTNTPYVCYSIGDSLIGPFDSPQMVYKAPEVDIFKKTTYTYNAKAHPQLSQSDSILVTYNTNTYNFEHNKSVCDIYNPRFLRFQYKK